MKKIPPFIQATLLIIWVGGIIFPLKALLEAKESTPNQTPAELSHEAFSFLVTEKGLVLKELTLLNHFPRNANLLGKSFQAFTIFDNQSNQIFELLVDTQTKEVYEADFLENWERQVTQEKYGKLAPSLYEYLQHKAITDKVMVLVWSKPQQGQSLAEREIIATAVLAAKYPQAATAVAQSLKPMSVDNPQLANQIADEYTALINATIPDRLHPIQTFLSSRGLAFQTIEGLPALMVSLTPPEIDDLQQLESVGVIYLAEGGERSNLLDSVAATNLTANLWTQGFDGTGIKVAILEDDNVGFFSNTADCPIESNNCFAHPGPFFSGMGGEQNHATHVASVVASNHPIYRGVAPDSTIISAGIPWEARSGDLTVLQWAISEKANIINASYGWCNHFNEMDMIDYAFDYYARSANKLIVAAAGESPNCDAGLMMSPAKGWNVLAVGAYDDRNDGVWGNDFMADWSPINNPTTPHGDHEKPELVAVGVNVTGVVINGRLIEEEGTSLSAPQVSGLAALLMERMDFLRFWPEGNRAVILASATHNIEGSSIPITGQDSRDGAGGINMAFASSIAKVPKLSNQAPCNNSCWWAFAIDNNTFPVDSFLLRYVRLEKGDLARIAISWLAQADCSSVEICNYDRLATDLHLGVRAPNGDFVGWSASWDNNYEIVEFEATQTGLYQVMVLKRSADEPFNYLVIAFLRLQHTYLPVLLKRGH